MSRGIDTRIYIQYFVDRGHTADFKPGRGGQGRIPLSKGCAEYQIGRIAGIYARHDNGYPAKAGN